MQTIYLIDVCSTRINKFINDIGSANCADPGIEKCTDYDLDFFDLLCESVTDKVRANAWYTKQSLRSSKFSGCVACFTPSFYVRRIINSTGASPSCILAALIYLERAQSRQPQLLLTLLTIQRLLLVAMLVAAKFLDDDVCLNKHWADVGGLTVHELNALELDFLLALDFELAIQPAEYARRAADTRAYLEARPHRAAPEGLLAAAGGQAWAAAVAARLLAGRVMDTGRCLRLGSASAAAELLYGPLSSLRDGDD